jgi:hypothetical protein
MMMERELRQTDLPSENYEKAPETDLVVTFFSP